MFTIDQIRQAHNKVKSGADFPRYINDIKQLGVVSYDTYVTDGHSNYSGANNFETQGPAKYSSLAIASTCDESRFRKDLWAHQQGESSFPTFCNQCAQSGIEKWSVSIDNMTCTYFDKSGNVVLVEQIPS